MTTIFFWTTFLDIIINESKALISIMTIKTVIYILRQTSQCAYVSNVEIIITELVMQHELYSRLYIVIQHLN